MNTAGETVAGNIAEEMSRRGWDVEQLADAADLSPRSIEPLLVDAAKMRMSQLQAIAWALEIPVYELARSQ